jgi:hypothetical protein
MIDVGQLRHLSSGQVADEATNNVFISDWAAVTIASWWASPAWKDKAFLLLAQKGRVVDLGELLSEIDRKFEHIATTEDSRLYLGALKRWATIRSDPRVTG